MCIENERNLCIALPTRKICPSISRLYVSTRSLPGFYCRPDKDVCQGIARVIHISHPQRWKRLAERLARTFVSPGVGRQSAFGLDF
jgi:hypothetical protein